MNSIKRVTVYEIKELIEDIVRVNSKQTNP